jgi:acetyl esterase
MTSPLGCTKPAPSTDGIRAAFPSAAKAPAENSPSTSANSRMRAESLRPCALVAAFAVADVTRTDRASGKSNAKISQAIQRLVKETYFVDAAQRSGPIASPFYDENLAAALPATLIMTGEYDTLAAEMDRLAERLAQAGVTVVHRRFAKSDHGFTHEPPAERAREAIALFGEHLSSSFARI